MREFKVKERISCQYCKGLDVKKKGIRENKRLNIQQYQCNSCRKYFILKKMLHKSYSPKVILNSISYYNKGFTLEEASKKINRRFGVKTYPKLISSWLNEFSEICSFKRIRQKEKKFPSPVFEKVLEHKQPYLFKYHKLKLDNFINDYYSGLKDYILNISEKCPRELFLKDNARCSQLDIVDNVKVYFKENYACNLAGLALKACKSNKERHTLIQDFMLVNDTSTIAVEVPIWLYPSEFSGFKLFSKVESEITGHIDVLQSRFGLIHVLDYKPGAAKIRPISQLFAYALALSFRTGIWLRNFRCAWFDENNYYEFNPNDIILENEEIPIEERRKYIQNEKARSYYTSLGFYAKRNLKNNEKMNKKDNEKIAGKVTNFS